MWQAVSALEITKQLEIVARVREARGFLLGAHIHIKVGGTKVEGGARDPCLNPDPSGPDTCSGSGACCIDLPEHDAAMVWVWTCLDDPAAFAEY